MTIVELLYVHAVQVKFNKHYITTFYVYNYYVDINECANGDNLCNQYCNNTDGSYVCSCYDGYTLSDQSDKFCIGKEALIELATNTLQV